MEEQPLINSMGIALANNDYDKLFEKGRGLPLKATRDYRTVHALRQGQRVARFSGFQSLKASERADRNRLIGFLGIKGEHIRRDLPAGSEVEIMLRIEESAHHYRDGIRPVVGRGVSSETGYEAA